MVLPKTTIKLLYYTPIIYLPSQKAPSVKLRSLFSAKAIPLHWDKNRRQVYTVSSIILGISLLGIAFSIWVWNYFCAYSLRHCFVTPEPISILGYFLLALIRPFTLLPQSVLWLLSAELFFSPQNFSFFKTLWGVFLLWFAAAVSVPPVYALGANLYQKLTKAWLLTHVPKSLKKAQKKSFSLALESRLLFFVHHDLASFMCGLFGFPFKKMMRGSLYAEAIKALLFGLLCLRWHPLVALALSFIITFLLALLITLIKQIIYLWQGKSYIRSCQSAWYDTFCEIQSNNIPVISREFDSNKTPILLLYGFFASRRTLTVMEKMLKNKGYEVFTLNLGGLFDVFFTQSIPKSAQNLDRMLREIMSKNNLQKISIVGHSKGGLVAAWWLLRLKGHGICECLITLGTPFGGTYFTWLALMTPLGLFWQDVWQMRPGSRLLKALQQSHIPQHTKIYCLYSSIDRISPHKKGVFQGHYGHTHNVIGVPMHRISHFQYLYKKEVMEKIHHLLESSSEKKR